MSFADMIAYAVAGIIIERIGAKSTLAFSFIISIYLGTDQGQKEPVLLMVKS